MNIFIIFIVLFLMFNSGACSQEEVVTVDENTTLRDVTVVDEENPVIDTEEDKNMSEFSETNPPTNPGIKVGSNKYTADDTVSLELTAEEATHMYISNDVSCNSGGKWEPYSTTKHSWKLSELNAVSNVYVKFKNEKNEETSCVSDSIINDQNPPTIPGELNDGAYTISPTESSTISWVASMDNESDVAYYELSLGTSPGDESIKEWTNVGKETSFAFYELSLTNGMTYYANIRAVDLVGNTSSSTSSSGFFYNYCYSISNNRAWVFVPGDADYGTNDFCVMKYEAKKSGETPVSRNTNRPWINIDQNGAKLRCESLGDDFHLLSNPEWMTIATNVANVDSNWSGKIVGSGSIFIGHSDNLPAEPGKAYIDDARAYIGDNCLTGLTVELVMSDELLQRRTLMLSYGDNIWDISGNAREWIDLTEIEDKPISSDNNSYQELNNIQGSANINIDEIVPTNGLKDFWVNSWNSSQGIGQGLIGTNGSGGGLTREGGYKGDEANGLLRFRLDQAPTHKSDTLGFRCAVNIP